MFGIGFFEIIIILFIVLIFIKPKDLPSFIRSIGRFYSQIRNAYFSILRAINSYDQEIRNMVQLDVDNKKTELSNQNKKLKEKKSNSKKVRLKKTNSNTRIKKTVATPQQKKTKSRKK